MLRRRQSRPQHWNRINVSSRSLADVLSEHCFPTVQEHNMASSPLAHHDVKYDFMSPLTSSSKIDLTLPFEDEFQNRLDIRDDNTPDNATSHPEHPAESQEHAQSTAKQSNDAPGQTTSGSPNTQTRSSAREKREGATTSPVAPPESVCSNRIYALDEYHQGLLQVAGTDKRLFNPSFRRRNSAKERQCGAGPLRMHRKSASQSPPAQGRPRPRPSNLVIPNNRRIPASAFNSESFWTDGDESATPRVTLTRYDLRADEQDIYGWKGDTTGKRNAIYMLVRG